MADSEIKNLKNIQKWEEKIIQIFPTAIPNICTWYDEIDILNILFTVCYKNLNNIYYPDGQALNLFGVDFAKEDKCIELINEESIDIIKPIKLSFHFYDNANSWSYFRLETDNLSPIYLDHDQLSYKEELISTVDGEYIDISNWNNGYYMDKNNMKRELTNKDQLVNRYYKKSSFLIFAKESPFKLIYNKSFNLLPEEELWKKIESLIGEE